MGDNDMDGWVLQYCGQQLPLLHLARAFFCSSVRPSNKSLNGMATSFWFLLFYHCRLKLENYDILEQQKLKWTWNRNGTIIIVMTMNSGRRLVSRWPITTRSRKGGVVIMTSALDTRVTVLYVESNRHGATLLCDWETDIFTQKKHGRWGPVSSIHVYDLARVVDELDIPVMALV